MRKNLVLFIILLLLIPTTVFADGTDARVQISGDVIVQADEVIMGDAITIMGNVTVDGKVTGDVVAIFGDVIVNGEVMGDVTAVGGRIIRGETSKVYGKVTEVKISGIADIANIIKRQGINMGQYNWNFARNWRYSWFRTVRFLGILAVGIFFVILFPNSIKTASRSRKPSREKDTDRFYYIYTYTHYGLITSCYYYRYPVDSHNATSIICCRALRIYLYKYLFRPKIKRAVQI